MWASRPCTSHRSCFAKGYNYTPTGIYHNFTFTKANYQWPVALTHCAAVIDGFSPNLNKKLHAGHLKNLAVASALEKIAGKSVAMLGASLGVTEGALDAYEDWCELAQYNPMVYFDTELPPVQNPLVDGEGDKAGCKLFNNVVIYKSNGKPTYAAHDLAFAAMVAPTHYLTGSEQAGHFASLGLGDKHLPLGLVLDQKGQKMKSKTKDKETGLQVTNPDAVSAQELFDEVVAVLDETPEPKKLAWNILAWQFNSSAVESNTKYNLEQWAKPESPGLYITYTYAKMTSALAKASEGDEAAMTENDVKLVGVANYFTYYLNKSMKEMQPCHVANYALTLAKALATAYGKQQIAGGEKGFIYAVQYATNVLKQAMEKLSMYVLTAV